MATLISDGNGRRCCSRCYNARLPICTCVCGGENHGQGLAQALQNTRQMAAKEINVDNIKYLEIDIERLAEVEESGEEDFGVRVHDDKVFIRSSRTLMHKNQLFLFEEEIV